MTKYPSEVAAIEELRKNNPSTGAYAFTRKLSDGGFNDAAEGTGWTVRTFYSILSVVRRFDAKNKSATKAA